MTVTNKEKSKPIYRKSLRGGISAAVFENTRNDRTFRSVNVQRSYYKEGQWHRMSIFMDHEHIPFMVEALESTWKFLNGDLLPLDEAEDNANGMSDASAPATSSETLNAEVSQIA